MRAARRDWRRAACFSLAALVVVYLVLTFVVSAPYLVPSRSMEPTLRVGDRIVVNKLSDPRPGDVVVFLGPSSWVRNGRSNRSDNVVIRGLQNLGSPAGLVPPDEQDFVKRVIATGGQTVGCCDTQGRVQVDGRPRTESYVRDDFPFVPGVVDCDTPRQSRRCFSTVTVPAGHLWLMGDNRSDSADSRSHVGDEWQGTVPLSNVRGTVWFRLWPPRVVS